jgi:phosphate uptake regulator
MPPEPAETPQHLAMLRILYGACSAALDAFQAADNPVDAQLVADLESMVSRTYLEIERLSAELATTA